MPLSHRLPLVLVAGLMAGGCPAQTGLSNTHEGVYDVQGNARVEFAPEELVWTDLATDSTTDAELVLSSVGDLNLVIYEVRLLNSADGVFFIEQIEDRTIAPGSALTVLATASLIDNQPAEGMARIKTNDSEQLELMVPLFAWPEGYEPPEDSGDLGE